MTTEWAINQSSPIRPGQPGGRTDRAEILASSGISIRLWRLYAQAWLVCLVFPMASVVLAPPPMVQLILAAAGLTVFVILYTWFMWPHPVERLARPRTSSFLFAALTALVFGLSLAYGSAFLWLFVGLSAVAGVALSARSAFVVVMILTLVTLGLGVWLGGGIARVDWLHLLPLVLLVRGLGLDMTGMARLSVALRELQAARRTLARQAVTDERLRLARDLHDLLGHTLSLITLKTELAGRLVMQAPTRAAQEIQEVERVARQALREVREAVSGYRQPTLRAELEGAREILEAAGIVCAIEPAADEGLSPASESVLAWAVREGVTNVIRHSRARHCAIRIRGEAGQVSVEVINDGYTPAALHPDDAPPGSGLAGLAERVTALGGQVMAGPVAEAQGYFRLRVEIPMAGADRVSEAEQE